MHAVRFTPKAWMQGLGRALQNPGQALGAADQAVANQAAARSARNQQAGFGRNRSFLETQAPDTVARRLVSEGVQLPAGMVDTDRLPRWDGQHWSAPPSQAEGIEQLTKRISAEGGRRGLVEAGVHNQMNRGRFGTQGFMEAVNSGIATNPYVRRVALPTAVVGGGALAGAGVTAGAQQLWALMDFMRAGEESEQRTAQSPLIQQA